MYTVHLTFDQPPVESMLDYRRGGTVVYSRDSVSPKSRQHVQFEQCIPEKPFRHHRADGAIEALPGVRFPQAESFSLLIGDHLWSQMRSKWVQNTSQLMKETNRSGGVKRRGCT
jgi:hypothetical protein